MTVVIAYFMSKISIKTVNKKDFCDGGVSFLFELF